MYLMHKQNISKDVFVSVVGSRENAQKPKTINSSLLNSYFHYAEDNSKNLFFFV